MRDGGTLALADLLAEVRACRLCAASLPLGPRPVLQLDGRARVLIASQAPGTKVHATGIPFNDASGDRLRLWLGVSREEFYDPCLYAILPMGMCYPGRGKSGDLPPRVECAAHWREKLLAQAPNLRLSLAIGQYALRWHFKDDTARTLTDIVKDWVSHPRLLMALPHPSPRNNLWLRRNPWFEQDLVPLLQQRVRAALS